MDSNVITAAVAGVPSIFAALFAYRASAQANKVTEETNKLTATKVDGEAYERSQAFYEKLIANAEKEMQRLQSQVDRTNDQLARVNAQFLQEQDISSTLRNHVRMLTTQMAAMELTVQTLRSQISRLHPPMDQDFIVPPEPSGPPDS